MISGLVNFWVSALVFGGDICYMIGNFNQFIAAVVWLEDNALVGFCDVVLKADNIFKTKFLAELGSQLHALIVNRIAPVKSNQGGGAVIPGEKFCAQQSPEGCIGIIIAHIYGDLKLVIHSQSVKQVA